MAGNIISDWIDGTIEKSNNYAVKFIGNALIVLLVSIILFFLLRFKYIDIVILLVGIISGILVINLNILQGNATFKLILNTGLFTFFGFLIGGLIFILIGFSPLGANDYGLFSGLVSAIAEYAYYLFAGLLVEKGFFAAVIAIIVKWLKARNSGSLKAPVTAATGKFGNCSNCGAPIETEDSEFCTDCGKPLKKAIEEKTDKKEYCDVCGRTVKEGDKICSNCGNLL